MDIRHKRGFASCSTQALLNSLHMRDILQARHRYPDQFRPGPGQPETLCEGRLNIISMRVAHRLHNNRVAAADQDIADLNGSCFHNI